VQNSCRRCGKLRQSDSIAACAALESNRTDISGFERSQLLLLPEAVDDYVGADNPVRFIDAFVDGLDLAGAGFRRVEPKATGRPGYAPGDLLKHIYGYLNRVRSSRRLEAECYRNIEIIWLLRSLKPDFKTIADFRSDNRAAFKKVFREFVILCRRLDLFGRELLAVDGTRIKAVNNKDRNFTTGSLQKFIEAADKKLEDYLKRLDAGDAEECATGGSRVKNLAEKIAALKKKRGEYAAHLSALEESGESQVSATGGRPLFVCRQSGIVEVFGMTGFKALTEGRGRVARLTTDMMHRRSSPEDGERKAEGSRNFYAAPKYKLSREFATSAAGTRRCLAIRARAARRSKTRQAGPPTRNFGFGTPCGGKQFSRATWRSRTWAAKARQPGGRSSTISSNVA
jgi:transposase